MPLHLLGKKSWHVYNADNIARVQRDEAAAKAAEEAEEQRMQEIDAQRRLAILRGEAPPPDGSHSIEDASSEKPRDTWSQPGTRRKRKRQGEDDTDFELRVAKERNEATGPDLSSERKVTSSAPIIDEKGHIDLFGSELTRAHAQKNEEAEAEAKKKKQSYEDQYTMRFTNAAGKEGLAKPWYSTAEMEASAQLMKDTWGRPDPKRRERDTQRIVSSDPLAMMKQAASKVRSLNQERKKFQEEREEELRQLRREERHREKRRRRREGEGRSDEREGRSRENESSSQHEEHRRRSRSRERSHRRGNEDQNASRHGSSRHDERRRSRGTNDESRDDEKKRSRDDERRRRRDLRSPDRERERHRRHHRDDRHE